MDTSERRLYAAAQNGDVHALRELLLQDELLLDRITLLASFNETPLHVAALRGHVDFIREALKHSPQLATEVDSRRRSLALHVASAKGYVEIVEALLDVGPQDMCFAKDREGRNPMHLAAVGGGAEALRVLIRRRPDVASEKTRSGDTVLHLCVKYDQLDALKMLWEEGWVDQTLVNGKDGNGNTILHSAVQDKQIETVKYLVNTKKMELNEKNRRGETALDILSYSHRRDVVDMEISDTLREAGALRAKELTTSSIDHNNASLFNHSPPNPPANSNMNHGSGDWLSRKRDSIMVVASLTATMAFQAGVNPTGGVWQDDQVDHKAGDSVMAYHHSGSYRYFIRANTVAFVSSLSTILLLISGLPFRRKLFMWILMMIMWLTITSIALTYAISIVVLTPADQDDQLVNVIDSAVTFWCGVMALLLLGNTIRLIARWLKKKKGIDIMRPLRKFLKSGDQEPGPSLG